MRIDFHLNMTTIAVLIHTWMLVLISAAEGQQCRDRFGYLRPGVFNLRSCGMCFTFLYQQENKPQAPLVPYGKHYEYLLVNEPQLNVSGQHVQSGVIEPDWNNETSVKLICRYFDDDGCQRWRECCRAASACCEHQLLLPPAEGARPDAAQCPRTWDGYSCWDDSPKGSTVHNRCPPFISSRFIDYSKTAVKHCTQNGTWMKNSGYEWTDYTPCMDHQRFVMMVYIAVAFNLLSVLMLLPAIGIFVGFKYLRSQKRIRMHIHFFASLTFSCVCTILWDLLVHYDLLRGKPSNTVIHRDPPWCRLLSFFKIHFGMTNYFWMACEGYYLHRITTNVFEPPSSLILLYLVGWALPLIPSITYAIIRSVDDDTQRGCWASQYMNYEWIIYIPNLTCLLVNIVFLCNILRIILCKLQANPSHASNARRGFKAALMLTPLFGLQALLVIYNDVDNVAYEYFSCVIRNSQGIFVAILYCLGTGEVLAQFKNKWKHIQRRSSGRETSWYRFSSVRSTAGVTRNSIVYTSPYRTRVEHKLTLSPPMARKS